MKILKTLMILGGMAFLFSACETEVIDPAGPRDEAMVPAIENLNPATFDAYDLENTFIQFDLTLPGSGVSQATLLVSYNRGGERKEVLTVSSFPANIKLQATEVASVLGLSLDEIEPADVFNFEVKTTQGGKNYFSSAAFNVSVVCGYDYENVTGAYNAFSGDWGMEGSITIEVDPADEYTVYVHGLAAAEGLDETGPVTMHINDLDYSVTVPRSTIAANLEPWDLPYTGYSFEGSGSVNTCNGAYSLFMEITVDQGSYGSYNFEFTRK